jgi:alpha-tubulin suppressor-like RCC1 family protein
LFVNGKCKYSCAGKDVEVNAYMEKFNEITNIYPMDTDEKIVDVAGGRNFITVVTDKGNVYASGSNFYGAISASILSNK